MLQLNEKAPEFSLLTDEGQTFKLADYLGKKHVVLYFYPRDFTAGCTREACDFRDDYKAIEAEDAVLIGVSTDSIESHNAFRQQYRLPFPLISDPESSLASLYDVNKGFLGLSPTQRVTYLIGMDGTIRGVFHHELAISKHRADILDGLRQLNNRRVATEESKG